jgi:hypothetical protein
LISQAEQPSLLWIPNLLFRTDGRFLRMFGCPDNGNHAAARPQALRFAAHEKRKSHGEVIAADGKVIYQQEGEVNILALRRAILANLADGSYIGSAAYWAKR